MSIECKETITCPECGHAQDFIMWVSLNGDLDPDAKQKLLDGTLFHFECENCGHISNVNYSMLYHDMTHKLMVYYVDEDSVEQTMESIVDVEKKTGVAMAGYRNRIVTDSNSLREKAIIFEHGLDDRVIEIIKAFYYENTSRQFPEANIRGVYFLVTDGKYILVFMGDKPLTAEIPDSLYDDIKTGLAEKLDAAGDKEAIIDIDWATKFLKS